MKVDIELENRVLQNCEILTSSSEVVSIMGLSVVLNNGCDFITARDRNGAEMIIPKRRIESIRKSR